MTTWEHHWATAETLADAESRAERLRARMPRAIVTITPFRVVMPTGPVTRYEVTYSLPSVRHAEAV